MQPLDTPVKNRCDKSHTIQMNSSSIAMERNHWSKALSLIFTSWDEVLGIAEAMRAESLKRVPAAMLSRAVVGIRGKTLIINLPGSPGGATENLTVLLPAIPHAVEKIHGEGGDCAVSI